LETKAKLFIQDLIAQNKVNLVWSYMLDFENSKNNFPQKRRIIQKWRSFAMLDIEESEEILRLANAIQKAGIKNADSLHLACAITAKCDYFVSVADRVLKYPAGVILLCNPVEFLKAWEELKYDEQHGTSQ
jgi:predicted nucleic acid-binding protein